MCFSIVLVLILLMKIVIFVVGCMNLFLLSRCVVMFLVRFVLW